MDEQNMNERVEENIGGVETDTSSQYVAAIKELKNNSVSKDIYDKLKSENAQLLDALINGGQININDPSLQADEPKLEDMILEFNRGIDDGGQKFNIEAIKQSVETRNRILNEKGIDVYLSQGYQPTDQEVREAQDCADLFEAALEYANGDEELFSQFMMNHTIEYPNPNKKKKGR